MAFPDVPITRSAHERNPHPSDRNINETTEPNYRPIPRSNPFEGIANCKSTPTNGRALLKFSPAFKNELAKNEKVYTCNIKYTPSDITLPTPTPWTLLWRLTSFIKHGMRVRITHRPVYSDLLDSLGKTGRMKSVGLSAKEKREFLEVWRKKR